MITVVNVRTATPGSFVYCGRRTYRLPQSPLGNPYKLTINTPEERKRLIEQYRVWLTNKIAANDSAVVGELARLVELAQAGDLALGCWCAPASCHCDVIKDIIEGATV